MFAADTAVFNSSWSRSLDTRKKAGGFETDLCFVFRGTLNIDTIQADRCKVPAETAMGYGPAETAMLRLRQQCFAETVCKVPLARHSEKAGGFDTDRCFVFRGT